MAIQVKLYKCVWAVFWPKTATVDDFDTPWDLRLVMFNDPTQEILLC